jgi:protocatechuate 3,4-dioxygenase beta subunit
MRAKEVPMGARNEINRREFLTASLAVLLGFAGLAEGSGCPSTENNPEGPFYIPGAPFRNRLAPDNQPGERLRIAGRVFAATGCEPLAGAVVDVWHASAAGFYYGLEATRPLKAEEFVLRGRIRTGEDGGYTFDTILPGNYRVTETWTRPRHIHYIVSHPSRRSLTTQLYFEGDPDNKTDPLLKPSLIIPLKRRPGAGTGYEGTFDIVLSA